MIKVMAKNFDEVWKVREQVFLDYKTFSIHGGLMGFELWVRQFRMSGNVYRWYFQGGYEEWIYLTKRETLPWIESNYEGK